MLCIPKELREESERLTEDYINYYREYTPEQYIEKFASKEYLKWSREVRKLKKEMWKRHIKI